MWETKTVPSDPKDATIITMIKRCDCSLCWNYRGIYLPHIASCHWGSPSRVTMWLPAIPWRYWHDFLCPLASGEFPWTMVTSPLCLLGCEEGFRQCQCGRCGYPDHCTKLVKALQDGLFQSKHCSMMFLNVNILSVHHLHFLNPAGSCQFLVSIAVWIRPSKTFDAMDSNVIKIASRFLKLFRCCNDVFATDIFEQVCEYPYWGVEVSVQHLSINSVYTCCFSVFCCFDCTLDFCWSWRGWC